MRFGFTLSTLLFLAWPVVAAQSKASYSGLFSNTSQVSQKSCGGVTITTTTKGAFTGQLQLSGRRVPLRGTFDSAGKASLTVKTGGMNSLTVDLQLDSSPAAAYIAGAVSDGTWTSDLLAERGGFDGKANVAPQAGRYTLVFPQHSDSTTLPAGCGYATVQVSKAGKVTTAGALADGTKFSQTAALSKDGRSPFYVSLYGNRGSAMTWLAFLHQPQTDVTGSLTWIKPNDPKAKYYPAGFTIETAVIGSAYRSSGAALSFESGDVVLGGGNLDNAVVNHVTLDSKNRVKNISANKLSLTLNSAQGTFRGQVKAPGTAETLSFGGIVMQSTDSGSGHFLGANQSGFVQLQASLADSVRFRTLGNSFAPAVELGVSPETFAWSWSDGTISTAFPIATKNFGSRAPRDQYLNVYPAGVLAGINIGFDGSDGATNAPIAKRANQEAGAVYFLRPLTGLRYWASSYNPITNTLDFTGFLGLEEIECFHCTNLQHVAVTNLPSLRRVCFESCDLQELDLSGDPNLEDVRAAINGFTEIKIGSGTGPRIWHFCVRDNPQITQDFQTIMTNFYSLKEPWFWSANQSGALKFVSTNLTDVELWNNAYTSADFTGQPKLEILQIQNNSLTNLVLSGCSGLQYLEAQQNYLPTPVVDGLLALLDTTCPNLQFVNLVGNAIPSAVGASHYSSLTNRGVTVYVDGF